MNFSILSTTAEFNPGPYMLLGMIVVGILGMVVYNAVAGKKPAKADSAPVAVPAAPVEVQAPAAPVAPGSAGSLKLHNVPPKTAAMLMAIVADKTGKPLNELRFVSIKEV